MISESQLAYGDDSPLPEQIELRAGLISLIFEDGCIRYLRIGEREILRRIYAAIRDDQWRTIPGTIRELEITRGEDSFRIGFVSEHKDSGVHYVWSGRIEGAANGTITFEFDGEAKSAFKRNRIGFCVLHPPDAVIGARCKTTHTDESTSTPLFPKTIAQEQPVKGFRDLRSISFEYAADKWVTAEFFGDVFETEDQRNWIDDSFKTYCTPLSLPLPVEVKPGDRVKQRVVVRVEGLAPRFEVSSVETVRITLTGRKLTLPKIGFAALGEPLAFSAATRLQQLKPAHLRVDAPMHLPDWQQPFSAGFREASALKCKVELALRLSGCPGEDLRDLITTFPEPFQHWAFTSSFARILLSTFGESSTSKRTLEAFRGFLLKTGLSTLDVPIGVGTEGDLYDFNLQRPPRDADLFFWSMNPQVHATDLVSISETPAGAEAQVRSVQEYFGDALKAVSPITLRPCSSESPADPRQKSLLGAVWTLGMLGGLAHAGATSATFFETAGPKGIMDNGGMVYPVYHIFRAVAGSAAVFDCAVSDPLAVAALLVKTETGSRWIFGNYKREAIEIQFPAAPNAAVGRLNKETAAPALEQPDSFWNNATPLSSAILRLAPFEIVFIDQPNLPEAF